MSFTVEQIREWCGGRVANAAVLGHLDQIRIEKPANLGGSGPTDITYFFAREYQHELPTAQPGVLVTAEPFVKPLEASGLPLWKKTAVIVCADPYLAMATLSAKFAEQTNGPARKLGVHASATVDPSATLGTGVTIGPSCVVEAGAKIGKGTTLYSQVYVGAGVVIGEDCQIFPNTSIYAGTKTGNRVRIHSGTVVGSDGFGYAPVKVDGLVTDHRKIHHLGGVQIGDDVEIGSNSCIDRGTIGDTVIESKVKIDNLVQIGHNCKIGEGAILCGKVGLAGSAEIGKFVYIGAASGVTNKVVVGDRAMVGGMTGVAKDVAPGQGVMGLPARDAKVYFRLQAMLNKMVKKNER